MEVRVGVRVGCGRRQEARLAIGDGGGALDHHLVHGAAVVRGRVRVGVRV